MTIETAIAMIALPADEWAIETIDALGDDVAAAARPIRERVATARRVSRMIAAHWVEDALPLHGRIHAALRDGQRTAPLRAIGQWARSSAPTMLVCGPPGTGKTYAAARWALHSRGERWSASQCGRYMDEQWASMRDPLAIDEIAAGSGTVDVYLRQRLHTVIIRRHDAGRHTLLVGNGTAEQILGYLDGEMSDGRIKARIGDSVHDGTHRAAERGKPAKAGDQVVRGSAQHTYATPDVLACEQAIGLLPALESMRYATAGGWTSRAGAMAQSLGLDRSIVDRVAGELDAIAATELGYRREVAERLAGVMRLVVDEDDAGR